MSEMRTRVLGAHALVQTPRRAQNSQISWGLQMKNQSLRLTCQQLYNQVWSKPIRLVAKAYGSLRSTYRNSTARTTFHSHR